MPALVELYNYLQTTDFYKYMNRFVLKLYDYVIILQKKIIRI